MTPHTLDTNVRTVRITCGAATLELTLHAGEAPVVIHDVIDLLVRPALLGQGFAEGTVNDALGEL